ncbi:hypothetical protein FACS1894187_15900 [Synergistales bacterium]|nr:hypothetical protein FACS1894187_15900 [Synergistales bacterium]
MKIRLSLPRALIAALAAPVFAFAAQPALVGDISGKPFYIDYDYLFKDAHAA